MSADRLGAATVPTPAVAVNGALVGLLLGLGLVLLLLALTSPRSAPSTRPGNRTAALLVRAGLPTLGAARFTAACAVAAVVTAAAVGVLSGSVVLALGFGVGGGWAPVILVRRRARRREAALRAVWPDVVDSLASAVRAGLTLPDALAQLGRTGSPAIAPTFERFAADYRASGRFGDSLDALKERLADPVADRIVESLRLAREVGGSDLGLLLRNLSMFLREDARTRGELEARQGWTVNAARVAAAAPWATLLMLSVRPDAVAAYDSTGGVVVLGSGALLTVAAYRLMLRIGSLPQETRVLR